MRGTGRASCGLRCRRPCRPTQSCGQGALAGQGLCPACPARLMWRIRQVSSWDALRAQRASARPGPWTCVQDIFTSLTGASKPHHVVDDQGVVLGYSHFGMLAAARWAPRRQAPDALGLPAVGPGFRGGGIPVGPR